MAYLLISIALFFAFVHFNAGVAFIHWNQGIVKTFGSKHWLYLLVTSLFGGAFFWIVVRVFFDYWFYPVLIGMVVFLVGIVVGFVSYGMGDLKSLDDYVIPCKGKK